MKKIIIVIILLLAGGGIYWSFIKKTSEVASDKTDWHQYAIRKLMTRVNPGNVKIEREVAGQSGFYSYVVSYLSENLKQYSLMHIPKGTLPVGGWPVVVVNHGYINPSEYSTVESYKNTSAFYAGKGFLVLKPDYRGNDKSAGTPTQLIARNQYSVDVANLVEAVKSIPEANPNLIFLYGHSLGGDVALQVAEISNKIKGVSLWAPAVTSYPLNITYFGKSHNADTENNTLEAMDLTTKYGSQLSALDNISMVSSPIIIQHSLTDESVPFAWGKQLNDALVRNGKKSSLYSYAKDNHNIAGHFYEALNRDVEFFRGLISDLD